MPWLMRHFARCYVIACASKTVDDWCARFIKITAWKLGVSDRLSGFTNSLISMRAFLGSTWSIVFRSRGPRRKVRLRVGYVTVIDWPWRPGRKPTFHFNLRFCPRFSWTWNLPKYGNVETGGKKLLRVMSPCFQGQNLGYSERSCTARF